MNRIIILLLLFKVFSFYAQDNTIPLMELSPIDTTTLSRISDNSSTGFLIDIEDATVSKVVSNKLPFYFTLNSTIYQFEVVSSFSDDLYRGFYAQGTNSAITFNFTTSSANNFNGYIKLLNGDNYLLRYIDALESYVMILDSLQSNSSFDCYSDFPNPNINFARVDPLISFDRYVPSYSGNKAVIDLIIFYTQAAADYAIERFGEEGISAAINLEMQEANAALVNSEVNIELNLVYQGLLDYDESNRSNGQILDHLTNPNDGIIDEVHDLRAEYNADMVSFFPLTGGGIAWILNHKYDPSWESGYMFNVTGAYNWGALTHAHEIGHNLGNNHSRNQNQNRAGSSGGRKDYYWLEIQ